MLNLVKAAAVDFTKRAPLPGMACLATLCLTGCVAWTSVSGIKPVYPKAGLLVAKVDSLQPEFRWQAGKNIQHYDFAIWDSVLVKGIPEVGNLAYQKTGLAGLSHRPDITLQPDTFYYWSVRETGSATWSKVTHSLSAGTPGSPLRGSTSAVEVNTVSDTDLFLFFTPKSKELEEKKR